MHEIQRIAKEYINDEEVSQVVATNKRQHGSTAAHNTAEQHLDITPHKRKPEGTIQTSKHRGIFPKARQLKERTGGNKTLYCDYHRGYEHRIQDCFDLKDALEQAIRDGKLPEFTKIIRKPKRAKREGSPEREVHNLRTQRQGLRETPETDQTIIVNVITGKDTPRKSKSSLKKDLKILVVRNQNPSVTADKMITFSPKDCQHGTSAEDTPFVISAKIRTGLVRRILVDIGEDSNILFRGAFDKLGHCRDNLQTHCNRVTRLGDNFIKPDGSIVLPPTIRTGDQRKTILSKFVVLKDSIAYNVILERKTINDLSVIIFTKFLLIKFTAEDGSIGIIHRDRENRSRI
ncbi:uncharacterized protein [Arachis hypogaea]|uniref:uncharacterized protein n=1 Tax=Arachis hypogaea TaxID=3818 RepID=UPI000DEC16F4|nr:uncharacterized protein LOC112726737 [Arachis hypogaea]